MNANTKSQNNPARERDEAAAFLGTCGPVTRETYQDHVANAVLDARVCGWSLETLGAVREELVRRLEAA